MARIIHKLDELLRVYVDLEKTLRHLRTTVERETDLGFKQIDIRKLIQQLSLSKQRMERKIGSAFLMEKQHLSRRIKALVTSKARAQRPRPNKTRGVN